MKPDCFAASAFAASASVSTSVSASVTAQRKVSGAEGGTRTRMGLPTRPSTVRVYQFHHLGGSRKKTHVPAGEDDMSFGFRLSREYF